MISVKVGLVLVLMDSYTNSGELKGMVSVKTHNGVYALKKSGNCFVFTNCRKGNYRIFVKCTHYESFEFDIYIDPSNRFETVYKLLMPSQSYNFFDSTAKLFGKAEYAFKIAFMYDTSTVRLLSDAKNGTSELSIFFAGNEFYDKYSWFFSDSEKMYCLKRADKKPMLYITEDALSCDISSDTEIGRVYDIYPNNGRYFAAVRGKYKKVFIIVNDAIKKAELTSDRVEYDVL